METMRNMIERNERRYPDKLALTMYGGRQLNYGELAIRARRLADGLARLGVYSQDRVAILSMNSLEYMEVFSACEWAGFIIGLLNFRSSEREVETVLHDCTPRVVFFELQYAALIAPIRERMSDIKHYICLDGSAPDWALGFEEVMESGHPNGPALAPRPSDYLYLFYTSGSTGKPKGVPWRHDRTVYFAQVQGRLFDTAPVVLQMSPVFHIGGRALPIGGMWTGGSTVLLRAFDPHQFLDATQTFKVTETFMVAAMTQAVLGQPDFDEYDLSSLHSIVSAGAPTPLPVLREGIARIGPAYQISYGSTECGIICQLEKHEVNPNGTPYEIGLLDSVGHFHPEVTGTILDDNGKVCKHGEIGEICVQSLVFTEYWNESAATVNALRDGWFHTGDMGYMDEREYVFLVGRKKDMIISGGENIYSREVENALHDHHSVYEACVIGVPDEKWGEAVKAIVVLRPGMTASAAEIIAHCQSLIARYKSPKTVEFLDALPRNGAGKIDKVVLRKQYIPQSD